MLSALHKEADTVANARLKWVFILHVHVVLQVLSPLKKISQNMKKSMSVGDSKLP